MGLIRRKKVEPKATAPEPAPVEHDWATKDEVEEVVEAVVKKAEPKPQALIIGKEYIDKQYVWKLKANYDIGQVGDIIE
tara:strand:+ start:3074 stop:3310 length:237 start_codon:yes stop_codon:yes gene_type:complete